MSGMTANWPIQFYTDTTVAGTREKGTLKKWLDDKGYGFITPDKGSMDIFVHISDFDRNIPRKPKVNDTIYFYTNTDNKGKTKAVDAVIEGAAPVKRTRSPRPRPKQSYQRRGNKSSWKLLMLCMVLTIGVGSTLYQKFQSSGGQLSSSTAVSNFIGSKQSQQFTCSGKTRCSQMTSCAEAKYYIRNCPNTKMDGDRDGVPCERQWCQ